MSGRDLGAELEAAGHQLSALADGLPALPGAIHLDLGDPIARLIIDNPAARGALTVRMMATLAASVRELWAWRGAALIVSSTADPRAFCAGAHLDEVAAALNAPEAGLVMMRAMTTVLDGLLQLPVVSVVATSGPCVGGGAELVTAADHRILAPSAYVRFVQSRLGISPGWGGAARLVTHVGRRRALRILTTGQRLDATTCVELGLVDEVDPDPVRAAERFLAPVIGAAPAAIRACKAQVVAAAALRHDRDAGVRAFTEVWGGPAHLDALDRVGKPR